MAGWIKRYAEPAFVTLFGRRLFYPLFRALYLVSLKGMGMNITFGSPTRGEARFLATLAGRLPARPTVFDVGANNGDFALAVAAAVPGARFYLFEPNPKLQDQLGAVSQPLDATVIAAAVSDTPGQVTLYDRTDTDIGVFASLSAEVVSYGTHQPVAAVGSVTALTLDGYAVEHDIARIDFLKIDVEGFELEVLRGARGLLSERRIGVVQFEFNYCNHIRRVFMADLAAALDGYRLHRILADGSLQPLEVDPKFSELFTYQNIVALPVSAQGG